MKAVIAIDSLKGSLTSLQAGDAIREGILRAYRDASVLVRPLADGDYLVRWTEGHSPNCRFVLESDEPRNSRFRAIKTPNGVRIGFQQFMILVR